MDEGQTFNVINTTFAKMMKSILSGYNAISGIPLYYICEFCWCKIFGYSEFALRSMNFIFALAVLWGGLKIVNAMKLPVWMIMMFALNPVYLYYMNEARPYAAVYACGLWCFYYLIRHFDGLRKNDILGFAICFWLGCALHMMFIFIGLVYMCLAFVEFRQGKLNIKRHFSVWLLVLPFFLLLAIHYFHYVLNANEVNSSQSQPLAGILQIGYYFAGLGGLGWSRNDLRCMNIALTLRIFVSLAIIIISYLLLIFYVLRYKVYEEKRICILLVSIAVSISCFLIANVVLKTRFWERHIIYLLPGISLILAIMFAELLCRANTLTVKVVVGIILSMHVLSGLNLLIMDYYQKDNYCGAVELARSFQSAHIFYQGDSPTFSYYGLRGKGVKEALEAEEDIGDNVDISNADKQMLDALINKSHGDIALILCEKYEFDTGNLFSTFSKDGSRVNSFSVVFLPKK